MKNGTFIKIKRAKVFSRTITCPRCAGTGTFTSGETCYYCKGSGTVEVDW